MDSDFRRHSGPAHWGNDTIIAGHAALGLRPSILSTMEETAPSKRGYVNFFYRRRVKIAFLLPVTIFVVGLTAFQVVLLCRGSFFYGEDYRNQPVDSTMVLVVSGIVCFVCVIALTKVLHSQSSTRARKPSVRHRD